MQELGSARIGVIGLGYVGLPLAVELGKQYARATIATARSIPPNSAIRPG